MSNVQSDNAQWSSPLMFILAALGSAVGLGNIWRFPYVVGENGGGAFVLLYLAFVLLVGLPALIATVMVGRRGQKSPILCVESVAKSEGLSSRWGYVGWLLVISAYLLLTVFSVVASWILDYLIKAATGAFSGIDAEAARAMFSALKSDPVTLSIWHGVFMGMTLIVVGQGIKKGIEKAVKMIMPCLFFILLVLVVYSSVSGNVAMALDFLFTPDFSKINSSVVLLAIGQALLTLSVGGAGMLVYGAYLGKDVSIPKTCGIVAAVDTLVALLAGMMIFPIVFAYGLTPDQGPGLLFVTLPVAFGQMPFGTIFATLFFVLLLLAALTTAFSMFEPVVAWLEERHGVKRIHAALYTGAATWLVGLLSVFSFNIWSGVRPLAFVSAFQHMTFFQSIEHLTANYAMPAGSFLITFFVGWAITEATQKEEFAMSGFFYKSWCFLARFLVPSAIALVFITNV